MTDRTHTPDHDVENATHRSACDECAAVWLDLERISAEAARLPRLTPSRDLWAGIESRLTTSHDILPAIPRARRSWLQRPQVRLAVAASLLVAATAGVTWSVARQGFTDAAPVSAVPTALQLVSFDNTVAGLDREVEELETILADQRKDLDPRTVEVLRVNLAVIDAAIRESRAALAADPGSRFLSAQVTRAYHSKLTLLRGAASLPTGI